MANKPGFSLNLSQTVLNSILNAILSNSYDGIAFITPDLKIRLANGSIPQLAGVTLETLVGSPIERVFPGGARQMSQIFAEVRRTGEPFKTEVNRFDFQNQLAQAATYWNVMVIPVKGRGGAFLGWLLMFREAPENKKDGTGQGVLIKEMEAQLKSFKECFENSPAGILLADGASLTVKLVNQAYLIFLDEPFYLNNLIGHSCADYLPQDKKSELLRIIEKVVTTAKPICMELLQRGESFWYCNVIPIAAEAGVKDILIITYDITEQVTNRKRMLKCAHQAENHFHQLETVIKNMEDGVIIFDLNGRIIKLNNAAAQLLGYGGIQDCPGNLFQIRADLRLYNLNGDEVPFEGWPSNRIIRGEIVRNFEAMARMISTGRMGYVSYNGAIIQDSNQTPALAIMTLRDITNRETLLRELEQEQSRLQAVLEQMPCGVIMFDAPSLKKILVNKKYTEIWRVPNIGSELTEQDMPGQFFHINGRAYSREELPIIRSISHGEIVSNEEMVCQRQDGSVITMMCNSTPVLDRDGAIVAGALVFSDITELKEATTKAALANQLQQIIEFLPDGIFVVDQGRKVIAWNRAIEVLTGVLKEEIIGSEAKPNVFDGFDQLTLIDAIFNSDYHDTGSIFERGGNVFSKQVLIPSFNQKDNVLLDIKATPILNELGTTQGVIEIIRDITNQKKMETETIRMQKLESLGILAGGIAHDFNNILAAILANLQLAVIKLQKHQDITKYLENSIDTTQKASYLTKQLLTFAKGGVPVKKTISVTNLVRDTVEFALCGSNVKAVFHLPEDLWPVDADEGQITQVINNLTINAEQAMPTGGILEIYGQNVICEAVGKYDPGNYVKLTVKDQGVGIPEAIIHQIFDPFFTTKKEGSGLGLSTSYSIIKKHNGYLEAESSVGNGAVFNIFLPASTDKLVIKEPPGEISNSGEAKILIMDDEDIIRNVSSEMLTIFGYRVMLARDGKEAIELYQKANEIGDPFAAIIMDLTIPGGMGGLETMVQLRRINPEVKAIVSSGYTNDPVISDYEKYGFSGVVIKPYKFDDLLPILHKVIEKRQLPLDLTY